MVSIQDVLSLTEELSSSEQKVTNANTNINSPTIQPVIFRIIGSSQDSSQNSMASEEGTRDRKRLKRSTSLPYGNDDKKVDGFFASIIKDLQHLHNPRLLRPSFIIVCHMASTIFSFLNAIKTIGDIALVIPKGYKRESAKKIIQRLKNTEIINDQNFMEPIENDSDGIKRMINRDGISIIKKVINDNNFIIIDIGGYFSKTFENMILNDDTDELRNKFLGIVEDTRNGHKKYNEIIEKLKKNLKFNLKLNQINAMNRLYSVAGCRLKDTEDYNVGKSIVEASETIMRVDANAILARIDIAGVIGFGKIGKSIAQHLRQKNLRSIIVYDKDPLKQMEASSLGFRVVDMAYLVNNSTLIFSATGNKCLKAEDLTYMKDNIFIASCTSSDDEFDISFCRCISEHSGTISTEHGNIQKLEIFDRNINLLDHGNAVNFVYGAVNGPYIYSVQAGLMAIAISLIVKYDDIENSEKSLLNITLKEPSKEIMECIARKWLSFFDNYHSSIEMPLNSRIFDDMNYTGKEYANISDYFEKNGPFQLENKKLKKIMDMVKQIVTNKSEPLSSINDVLINIRSFLKRAMFAPLMVYISELLIKILMEREYSAGENYHLTDMKLCLLKETALLYLNINNKENQVEQVDLERDLDEIDTKLSLYIIRPAKLEEKEELANFLKVFLSTIEFFNECGMEFKTCLNKIERIFKIWNELTKEVKLQQNKLRYVT